jgi:large subunit ribosomal protein L4
MPKVAVYNIAGEQTGELNLDDNVFNVEVLDAVLHQAVVMQQSNLRHGNASTKTSGFVRGGGR